MIWCLKTSLFTDFSWSLSEHNIFHFTRGKKCFLTSRNFHSSHLSAINSLGFLRGRSWHNHCLDSVPDSSSSDLWVFTKTKPEREGASEGLWLCCCCTKEWLCRLPTGTDRNGIGAPPGVGGTLQDCPMLVIILINMSTKQRRTPYNELKHELIIYSCIYNLYVPHNFLLSHRDNFGQKFWRRLWKACGIAVTTSAILDRSKEVASDTTWRPK